jgi:hypothetical protein
MAIRYNNCCNDFSGNFYSLMNICFSNLKQNYFSVADEELQ